MILLALLLQASPVADKPPASDAPQRWSILVPVTNEPCRPAAQGDDILVCADPLPSQRLPLPDEVIPDGPRPSNPNRTGAGALAASATPCATRMGGCTVGFGPPIVPIVKGLVGLAEGALTKKPDKAGRVTIPLDDPPPPATGGDLKEKKEKQDATQPSGG
ncbi:hypothetical protein [Sphingomonas alpina]|uniref:Uncharacterized protein n=1 Tax=Sphingomonas alpina TaxID=653931 RepID=A0A7H0LEM2_9SPHN|nr:hypothetical protein [Sphingomonas alpina]QNQ08125.1 hypothetical protein H3Z74_15270 [Sphingomonas alpina]